MNQPITYRPGTRITKHVRHGELLTLEIGAPCDVRIRTKRGDGNRYRVTIDATAVDDSPEGCDTQYG